MKERFDLDTSSETQVSWLRGISGGLVVAGGVWLIAADPGASGIAIAVLGLLAGLGLVASSLKGRRRAQTPTGWYLELDESGLTLVEGPKTERRGWSAVDGVNVDEDRLLVIVSSPLGDLKLEPRYRNQSVYALRDAVTRWWQNADALP